MSRVGRKRKGGKRHPDGRLVQAKPDLKTKTSRQPHRRGLKDALRADERAGSPLGRLLLRGEIDAEMFDAGNRYAYLVGQYLSVIDTPRATAGSGRRSSCVVEQSRLIEKTVSFLGVETTITSSACRKNPDACECFKRKSRYDAAYEAVLFAPHDAPGRQRAPRYVFTKDTHPALQQAIIQAEAAREGYLALPLQDQKAAKAVARVAVHGEEPTAEEFVHLVRGLLKLKDHFGLTERRRVGHCQNAN